MFREFLVYHNSSLEFRAGLITLMILSDGKISKCEIDVIEGITTEIYPENPNRAKILDEAIHEYHQKISTNNDLGYNELINKIAKDIRNSPRFTEKINIEHLNRFRACLELDDEKIFHDRVIDFLVQLKEEYSKIGSI